MKESIADKLLEVMKIYSLKQQNRWNELIRDLNTNRWSIKKKKNRRKMKNNGKTI
jgi:uncharacterized membrane protein YheB (UPF0754 family)